MTRCLSTVSPSGSQAQMRAPAPLRCSYSSPRRRRGPHGIGPTWHPRPRPCPPGYLVSRRARGLGEVRREARRGGPRRPSSQHSHESRAIFGEHAAALDKPQQFRKSRCLNPVPARRSRPPASAASGRRWSLLQLSPSPLLWRGQVRVGHGARFNKGAKRSSHAPRASMPARRRPRRAP